MVIMTNEGWLGADGKYYGSATEAYESFAKRFGWPKPSVSAGDRVEARQLRIFLAHAKEDKPMVRDLRKRLSDAGVDVWLDEVKLLPGQKWRSEISKAIRNSDAFLACLSKIAVSKVGYVNYEFKEAMLKADEQPEGKIFVIPVRLEPCEVQERFSDIQWVDYFEPTGFGLLLKSLQALAGWLGQHGSKVILWPNHPMQVTRD
jgi:hypothetical protein